MTTDNFIKTLVETLKPVRPRSCRREACILVSLGCAEIGLLFLLAATRADLSRAMLLPIFWWKLGSLGVISVIGAFTTLRSLDPTHSPLRGLMGLLAATSTVLLCALFIDAGHASAASLVDRLMVRHGIHCIIAMVVLSLPALIVLAVLIRRGAPTHRSSTGLAASTTSAAWGALVFAFRCPYDDPFYVAVWYVIGCGIVTCLGHLVLNRVSRW